jgi:DNA-binding SARP family transcriptional activator
VIEDSSVGCDLEIRLLGPFLLTWKNEQVIDFHSSRLQSLLAYLLLNREAPVSRRQIAFEFWPDSSETQALSNLRNLLTTSRRIIPEENEYIIFYPTSVQWNKDAPYHLDVKEFEEAITIGNFEKAVCIYAGDLLPDCYDDWIQPHRERTRQDYYKALEILIKSREEARDYQAAIKYSQIYLQYEPYKESLYRRLLRLHALNGDRAEAVRVYKQCENILEAELGITPENATINAYEQILRLSTRPEPTCGGKNELPLIGRKIEWGCLLEKWRYTDSGNPGMLLLIGEAGIGKTRLLEEFRDWAYRQGISTAYSRCYSFQGRLAYVPAVAWLRCPVFKEKRHRLEDVWLSEIARLLPELSQEYPHLPRPEPIKESWQQMRLFEALARAVFSAPQPVLLFLDDLHWVDKDSLTWLSFLLRYDPQARLLLVSSLRPEETAAAAKLEPFFHDLKHDGLLAEIELGPFTLNETQELAGSVSGGNYSSEEGNWIYKETEGNPLFIVEMVRNLAGEKNDDRYPVSRGIFHRSYSFPGKVEAVIGSRLSQLDGQAQALAALAAASGRKFNIQILIKAWKSSEQGLVQGLDDLLRRRIIREQEEGAYDFSHDKIREAVYLRLSRAHRRLLHRELALALETVHSEGAEEYCGEIAGHYIQAGQGWLALPYLLEAAELAVRLYANQEAITHLQRGVNIISSTTYIPERTRNETETIFGILDLLGDILGKIGEHQEARETYKDVFKFCPCIDQVRLAQTHRKIGQTWLAQQDFASMLQAYRKAEQTLGLLEENLPLQTQLSYPEEWFTERLNIHIQRMWVYYWIDQADKIQELADQVLPFIDSRGTPLQRANFYVCLGGMLNRKEKFIGSQQVLDFQLKGLKAALESGEKGFIGWSTFCVGFSLMWSGLLEEGEEHLLESRDLAQKYGDENTLTLSTTYLSILYRKKGDLKKTRTYAGLSLELATPEKRPMYAGIAAANLAWLEWRAGNYKEARRLGEDVLEMWDDISAVFPFKWVVYWPLIGVSLANEDIHTAIEHVRNLLSPEQQPPPQPVFILLNKCLEFYDSDKLGSALIHVKEAALLARENGYL